MFSFVCDMNMHIIYRTLILGFCKILNCRKPSSEHESVFFSEKITTKLIIVVFFFQDIRIAMNEYSTCMIRQLNNYLFICSLVEKRL